MLLKLMARWSFFTIQTTLHDDVDKLHTLFTAILTFAFFRLSREFGNPPSYEELEEVNPIKEEEDEPVKPTSKQC